MINPAQPPEGILDPQQPWWPADRVSQASWLRLKGKLTGRPIAEMSGERHTSYVKLGDADADRLIENLKKYGQYPQVNQNDKYGGAYNAEAYQKWLVEEFLEKPFREQVNDKIDKAVVKRKVKEVLEIDKETEEVAAAVEEPEQLVSVVEDKIDALEAIREEVAPPRSKYQPPPDPWGDPTVPPKVKATAKKTKKKASKRKKRKEAPEASQPPKETKQSFATKMGGSVGKTGKGGVFNSVLSWMEGGSSQAGEGPSVLQIGAAFGRKVQTAFDDAQEQKERALEAEANGAELPPEVKEKGYFLKKALGYQFGGQVYDQTLGAFLENMPSKQSKKKAGFGAQFDYGDSDPSKKKRQDSIKDLATGFRRVSADLRRVNSSLNENLSVQTSLLGEQTRIADTLEQIQNAIAGLIDIEIDSGSDAADAAAAGDINIGDINLGKKKGFDLFGAIFDIIDGVDDVFDIMRHLRGGKKGLGRQNRLYRNARKKGLPNFKKPRIPKGPPKGKFGMLRTVLGGGLQMLSEGGTVKMAAGGVPAMIGEAGPEVLMRGGSSVSSLGLSSGKGLEKLAQPFANVLELPMQVAGAQISGAITNLVAAAGPFSGAIAKMFSPLLGGLATVFGLNQGAFAAEINSAAMTEKQGAKELSKFFANFFKLFGISFGEDDSDDGGGDNTTDIGPIKEGPMFEKGAQIAKELQQKLGIKDYQAAGIVGNLIQESSLVPDRIQGSGMRRGPLKVDGVTGYSYPQWTSSDRQQGFANYMESKGHDWKTQGATNELATGYVAEEFKGYMSSVFTNTKDVAAASKWVLHNYEKPADQGPAEQQERATDSASVLAKMSKGGVMPTLANSFTNTLHGAFEISGPDSGYRVPPDLTGGQEVIGHGIEYLFKLSNKFVILPVQNKEYDAYRDPEEAFQRYEQIGKQGGVEVAGLVDAMDRLLFGKPKTGKMPVYGEGFKPRRTYGAADESGAEVLKILGGTPVRGASLPEGTVTPVAIPKDTVTGTTGQAVAVVQPMIQYVPVPGPSKTVVQEVPANVFLAARKNSEMLYLQGLS